MMIKEYSKWNYLKSLRKRQGVVKSSNMETESSIHGNFLIEVISFREQTIDEVHIYIDPPKFLLPKHREEFKK